jgi:HK97 family phage major capsid protein
MVPNLLLHRTTMDTSNIANLVGSQPRGDLFVDRLQPQSAVMQAGATVLSGLSKAITVPKETGELTASFVAEGSAVSESSLTIGSLTMTPRRVSSTASFTLEALVQSDPQIDSLIRTSLTRQIAQVIDDAALEGSGTAPNPTGIVNTSGIKTLTTAGSSTLTYAEALTALSKLEEDNVSSAGAVFVMHPTDYSTIAATLVDSGSGRFVIEDGRIMGRRVVQSTLASAGTVVLGDFRQCVIGFFGGTDLVVDNVTEARSAKVLITQHQMTDVAVRHAEAFCAITLTA